MVKTTRFLQGYLRGIKNVLTELKQAVETISKELEILKKQLAELEEENGKCNVGFENDNIFLLSIDEYEMYKDKIPYINICWWLRGKGCYNNYSAYVTSLGGVGDSGNRVDDICVGIRPAIKYKDLKFSYYGKNKHKIIVNGFPFKIIDEENKIAIAEVPIHFNMFDDTNNNYKTSYVRNWLLDWINK